MALDFLAGCVGGAAGIIVAHPLDTVKVRIQTQCPVNPKYRGTFHCLTTTIKAESISGLYKGIASPLYGVTAINALIFGVYGSLKPLVEGSPGNNALWAHFLAGSAAGAVQSVIASPMELIKTRMQLDESVGHAKGKAPSAAEVMRNVYRTGGVRKGIFKGWCVTLSREIPGLGAYFATYEALTRNSGCNVTTLEMLFAGGMAGIASWVSCFPMDVIKTRLQSDTEGKYSGAVDCYRKTIAAEGYRALFRGLNSTLIRAFPSNAATFTVVTWIMRLGEQRLREREQNGRERLEMLLEPWDSIQENLKQTLNWKVPQYALISPSVISSFHFFEGENRRLPVAWGNQEERSKCVPNEERLMVPARNEEKFSQGNNTRRNVEESAGKEEGKSVCGSIVQNPVGEITGIYQVGENSVNFSMNNNNGAQKSEQLHGGPAGNWDYGGSAASDLNVLAEILDLPVVVLETSLEGKPLTLFNILLTWLKQGTRFTFCKCLDALDHCVCFNY